MECKTERISFQTENKVVSMAFKIAAIFLAAMFVLGTVGCTKQAIAHGYILGFQFESCFVLFMFAAITMMAGYLADWDTDCDVMRKCSEASAALAAMCIIGTASYYAICESPGSHSGDISSSIPYGILISGAILVMLFLLFRRFIRMKKELEDFV